MSLVHLVPYSLDEDVSKHYKDDHNELIDLLKNSFNGLFLDIYTPEIHSPYPIGITLNSIYRMKRVMRVLAKGIAAIVNNYFKDERLHASLLQLSEEAKSILHVLEGRPYAIGSWRPDLLFPKDSSENFLICEINARYAFNGYYASHEKNKILNQLSYLKSVPIMPVSELADIPEVFRGVFQHDKPVGILKADPAEGWDVKMFQSSVADCNTSGISVTGDDLSKVSSDAMGYVDNALPEPILPPVRIREVSSELRRVVPPSISVHSTQDQSGVRFVRPNDLAIVSDPDGRSFLKDSYGHIEQFAIECSQRELIDMDREKLCQVLSCPHINDLRTIFIAHDKRMLSVLTNKEIMMSYLDEAEVQLLSETIIKTYVVGVHADIVKEAKANRHQWMIKPNGGGKGIGIIFGKDCSSDEEWANILDYSHHASFVLQRVVEQHSVAIQRDGKVEDMLVVGLVHCFNDKFLGPGIFRASSLYNPIVNVSGGNGIIMSPAVLSCRWKLSRKLCSFDPSSESSESIDYRNLIFELPTNCTFQLPLSQHNCQDASGGLLSYNISQLDDIWSVLSTEGVALVHCPWSDALGTRGDSMDSHEQCGGTIEDDLSKKINLLLLDFINQIGGIPHEHTPDGPEQQVWDVRPFFDSIHTSSKGAADTGAAGIAEEAGDTKPPPPRSHTADHFDMHTDCSFEDPPPRYMALYVMQEDRCGGGYSTLIDTEALNRYLSRQSFVTLLKSVFTVRVPPEFYKGTATIRTNIVTAEEKLWKYRSDVIVREDCSEDQLNALNELDSLLQNPCLILTTMLPTGSILLLDNMRWFHGRSAIRDRGRWLKRIRFCPSEDRQPPMLRRLVTRTDSLRLEHEITGGGTSSALTSSALGPSTTSSAV